MRLLLDVLFEEIPGQETQAELPLPGADIEEIHGIKHLRFGDVNIDGAKVLGEAVANENDTKVEQDPKLLIGNLEADKRVCAKPGV